MKLWKKIKNLDNKFSWSFWSFIIGILGLGSAIYTTFIYKENPSIKFEILTNTSVLDLKENLSKLDIIYSGEKIRNFDQELRITTIKIINTGNVHILKESFDENDIWGFEISNSKIIEKPQIINSSSDYITKNLTIRTDTLNKVFLSSIMFDRKDFFVIKILSITEIESTSSIQTFGKVAGIKTFDIVDTSQDSVKDVGFFKKLLHGNFLIHFSRFWFYLFVIAISATIIFTPIIRISTFIDTKKKRKTIDKFRKNAKVEFDESSEIIFDIYLDRGESTLARIQELLADTPRIKRLLRIYNLKQKEYQEFHEQSIDIMAHSPNERPYIFEQSEHLVKELLDRHIITVNRNQIIINESSQKTLDEFIYTLRLL